MNRLRPRRLYDDLVKPIPDKLAARNPELYALFTAWVEASKGLPAAILQGDPRAINSALEEHNAALRAYMDVMQKSGSKARAEPARVNAGARRTAGRARAQCLGPSSCGGRIACGLHTHGMPTPLSHFGSSQRPSQAW